MRTSEMLITIAKWLESSDNEILVQADHNEESLKIVVASCLEAAQTLRSAADAVDAVEVEPQITPESIETVAALADALDSSDDPELKKQASVLDELLLSIAAPPNAYAARKDLQEQRLIDLKKKYEGPREELHKVNMIDRSEKAIEKSEMTKRMNILEAPLSSRYCPDHPGVQIARVGEHMWQCEMDKKTYNFETGFDLNNGTKVPGGDVSQQTQGLNTPFHAIFDTREGRLGTNR